MWVSLEAINENFIETGGGWPSGPLFIGKISSLFEPPQLEKRLDSSASLARGR
jgi:hypothetical protein